MNDGINLIDDRRLDMKFARAFVSAFRGRDSFRDRVGARRNLLDGLAAAEPFTDAAIAAEVAETSGDQIPRAAQSIKRARVAAHRGAEPQEFGESPGDKRSLRVIAESKSVARPGRDREHIF